MTEPKTNKQKPTVLIKSSKYQPSVADLKEKVHIPASPEKLAKAVLQQVKIETE